MSQAPAAVLVNGGKDADADADAEGPAVPQLPADPEPAPEKEHREYVPAPGDVKDAVKQAVAESEAVAEKSRMEAIETAGGTAGAGGATGGATMGEAETGGETGTADATGSSYHGIETLREPTRDVDVKDILKAQEREKAAGHWRWVLDSNGGKKNYPAEVLQQFGLHHDGI